MGNTTIDLNRGNLLASDCTETFETLDRSKTGKTLTPNVLTLERVYYEPIE